MRVLVLLWLMMSVVGEIPLMADTRVETYFDNTDHTLTVYYIDGNEPGNTMLIIGGIQGDEPGGYIAADLYADILLEKGNLIVVPRANFLSIKMNTRGVNGDMNRKFSAENNEKADYDSRIVDILKELMSKSDVLLNLHEGSGYYYPEYVSDLKNPMRYGQSIIIDSYTYTTADSVTVDLGSAAIRVIDEINSIIRNPDHFFHLNNHDTFSPDSRHKEQRGSATFNALTLFGIPGYGIETSKNITSIDTKVKYETLAINAFMKEYDIIPEHPSIYLPTPELDHLVIMTDGNPNPYAVKNGATLSIPGRTRISVTSVVANYKRGISVDIIGHGNSNDLNKEAVLHEPTKIIVYKDAYKCGEVKVDIHDTNTLTEPPHIHAGILNHIIVHADGKNIFVSAGDTLHIVRGDVIRILDGRLTNSGDRDFRLNFRGFVGNRTYNDAEDRGYDIDTSNDLIERFSLDGEGRLYCIEAIKSNESAGMIFIALDEPEISYVIVEDGEKNKLALKPGETVSLSDTCTVRILSVISNVTSDPAIGAFVANGNSLPKELILPAEFCPTLDSRIFFRRTTVDLGTIFFAVGGKT